MNYFEMDYRMCYNKHSENKNEKVRVRWHRLLKDATSRVEDEPKVRTKSLMFMRYAFVCWDYPDRCKTSNWKKHRGNSTKRGISSVGRVVVFQTICHRFEPDMPLQFRAYGVSGNTIRCQRVVAGSSPARRSKLSIKV